MAMFDKIKKAVGDFSLDKLKTTVVGEKFTEKPIMKITMLGARGVGKTSVLTSMYNNMNTAVNDTRLHIVADHGTNEILSKKTADLKGMFFGNSSISDTVHSGIAGDSIVSVFSFDFGLNTENINMGLEIRDFPGEFVKDQPDTVKQYIEESNAVIVAIDTPHMMECDGRYNEGKNYTALITSLFQSTLNAESGEKLIMLVPLKCEKYYHEGRIEQVTEKVKSTYQELIKFLKAQKDENGKARYACVITPIQTVGQIVFDCFDSTDGKVDEILLEGYPIPRKVNYKYTTAGAKYSPCYCEQPLYYLLSFVSKQYLRLKSAKEDRGWIRRLQKMWALTPNLDAMLLEIQKMDCKKVSNLDGFVTVFGRSKV